MSLGTYGTISAKYLSNSNVGTIRETLEIAPADLTANWQDSAVDVTSEYADRGELVAYDITVRFIDNLGGT